MKIVEKIKELWTRKKRCTNIPFNNTIIGPLQIVTSPPTHTFSTTNDSLTYTLKWNPVKIKAKAKKKSTKKKGKKK